MNPSGEDLFNKEQADLLQDLFEIPQRSCDRKVPSHMLVTPLSAASHESLAIVCCLLQIAINLRAPVCFGPLHGCTLSTPLV